MSTFIRDLHGWNVYLIFFVYFVCCIMLYPRDFVFYCPRHPGQQNELMCSNFPSAPHYKIIYLCIFRAFILIAKLGQSWVKTHWAWRAFFYLQWGLPSIFWAFPLLYKDEFHVLSSSAASFTHVYRISLTFHSRRNVPGLQHWAASDLNMVSERRTSLSYLL